MKNIFTVDLEDWFCSHNLLKAVKFEDWGRMETRVEFTSYKLLNLLLKYDVKATFFILGWVAERFPALVEDIRAQGHEIASHGYNHKQITLMSREEFEQDIAKSVEILFSITGAHPSGYRAPAFSITPKTNWALNSLKEQGFLYDSSIYPFSSHPDYGDAACPISIHQLSNGLIEVPLSCGNFLRKKVPCSGGAYLRFYPEKMFHKLVRQVVNENRPYVFYIHPWELDEEPPAVKLSFTKHLRHYYNTRSTFTKIENLLKEFQFTTMKEVLHERLHHHIVEASAI